MVLSSLCLYFIFLQLSIFTCESVVWTLPFGTPICLLLLCICLWDRIYLGSLLHPLLKSFLMSIFLCLFCYNHRQSALFTLYVLIFCLSACEVAYPVIVLLCNSVLTPERYFLVLYFLEYCLGAWPVCLGVLIYVILP